MPQFTPEICIIQQIEIEIKIEPVCGGRASTNMSTDSDSNVNRYSAENPAVFGELYERHAPPIHRYAVRRVGASAADDTRE